MNKLTERRILLAAAAVFLVWSAGFITRSSFVAVDGNRYFCLGDDAMISMRYAANLVSGHGPVWNPDERVEGYTNFLMVLVMAAKIAVLGKTGALLGVQIFGAAGILVTAWLARSVADEVFRDFPEQDRIPARTLGALCVLCYYPLLYWTLLGMETGLLTVLLTAATLAAVRYAGNANLRDGLLSALLLGLAFLTRPDSGVFALVGFGGLFLVAVRSRKPAVWRHLFAAGAVYAAFVVGLTVFRYAFYGQPVPNTYTLKMTGMPIAERLRNGITFMGPFWIESAPVLLFAAGEVLFDFRRRKVLPAGLVLGMLAYQVWIGGDMSTYWRIAAPAMPLALVLFAGGAVAWVRSLSGTEFFRKYVLRNPVFPPVHAVNWVSALVVGLGCLAADCRFAPEVSLMDRPAGTESNLSNVNISIALQELTSEDASVGVFWAGTIPYFTGRRGIDFLGKCDSHIAGLPADISGDVGFRGMNSVPGHNKYDLHYSIKQRRPTYVQRFKWGGQDLTDWARDRYVEVTWRGVKLLLLRSSPHVHWDKALPPAPATDQ